MDRASPTTARNLGKAEEPGGGRREPGLGLFCASGEEDHRVCYVAVQVREELGIALEARGEFEGAAVESNEMGEVVVHPGMMTG